MIILCSVVMILVDVVLVGFIVGGCDQVGVFVVGWLNLFFLIDVVGNEMVVWSVNVFIVGFNLFGDYVSWVFGYSVYWIGMIICCCVMWGLCNFEVLWQLILIVGNISGIEVVVNCFFVWLVWVQLGVMWIKFYLLFNLVGGGIVIVLWCFLVVFLGKDIDMGCVQVFDMFYYIEECVFLNVGQQFVCVFILISGVGNFFVVFSLFQGVGFIVLNGDV